MRLSRKPAGLLGDLCAQPVVDQGIAELTGSRSTAI